MMFIVNLMAKGVYNNKYLIYVYMFNTIIYYFTLVQFLFVFEIPILYFILIQNIKENCYLNMGKK